MILDTPQCSNRVCEDSYVLNAFKYEGLCMSKFSWVIELTILKFPGLIFFQIRPTPAVWILEHPCLDLRTILKATRYRNTEKYIFLLI